MSMQNFFQLARHLPPSDPKQASHLEDVEALLLGQASFRRGPRILIFQERETRPPAAHP